MASPRQIPSVAVAAFCLALAAVCALTLIASDGFSSSQTVVLSSKQPKSSDFATVWNDWLHRVNREVKAAVGISDGLSPQKKVALNGLLSNDLSRDLRSEKSIVAILDDKYAAEHKKPLHIQPKASKSSKPVAAAHGQRKLIAAATPAKTVAKVAITRSPINKKLAAKIAVDDSKVAAAEKQVHMAAKDLMKLETQNIHTVKAVPNAATPHAVRSHATPQTPSAATEARMALVKKIQKALSIEMKRSRGDEYKIRALTNQEEKSWGRDLQKWGLSR